MSRTTSPADYALWCHVLLGELDAELCSYDLATTTLTVHFLDDLGIMQTRSYVHMPGVAVDAGHVHPDSISTFCDIFQRLENGEDGVQENVMLLSRRNNAFGWSNISFHMQYDDAGTPVRAVGLRRDLENDEGVQSWYGELPEALWPDLVRTGTINLATRMIDAALVRHHDSAKLLRNISLEEGMRRIEVSLCGSVALEAYRQLLDPERLAKRFEEGRRWSVGWFRMIDGGVVKPMRIAVNVRKGNRGNLVARTFTSCVQKRDHWESQTDLSCMRDAESLLYRRDYARVLVPSVLREVDAGSLSSLSVIQIIELEPMPKRLKADLACAIGVFLGVDCIPYRFDEESVGVLVPSAGSDDELWHRLSDAIAAARASLVDADQADSRRLSNVRIIAESIYATPDYLDIVSAADMARSACERRATAPDGLAADFVQPPVSQYELLEQGGSSTSDRVVDNPMALGSLSDEEIRAFALILSTMLNSGSTRQAITAALRGLGMYHGARRVYLVMVNAHDGLLNIPFEWSDAGTMSIKGRLSDTPALRFPFIARNIGATHPVYVSRPRIQTYADEGTIKNDTWRFCIVPVEADHEVSLAICIDDPTRHFDSWELDRALAARVFREWRLLRHSRHGNQEHSLQAAGELPGRHDLERTIGEALGEGWSSCGALAICVPHPDQLVKAKGLTYAIEVVASIKGALSALDDENAAYQISDTEFVVLFSDVSYRTFVQRCAEIRTMLVTAHPSAIHVGSAWTGIPAEVRNVVDEALAIAQHDNGLAYDGLGAANNVTRLDDVEQEGAEHALGANIAERFVVYLQPKIDARSGQIVGAEALARYVDVDGRPISPVTQIDHLERSDEVAALDYYVFDETLSLMSEWKERGYSTIPVSTNFSRATLLSPTSLASVLAIMSRHPNVAPDTLEMEVTESALDLGTVTLNELVSRFRSLGLRIALDDFGSHYSSMSVLANVTFDTIKLDRSLVYGLPDNPVSASMVRSISEICHEQGMACVAEGVESKAQARMLIDAGCPICQGFYYDKPLPPDLFEEKYLV
ncbi:EAL domain-containing protein [Collinsella sp. An2]|uniref:EAL domain-containing protein n=1 Tax=Collinsella sp. An2 TaxID=1965585 RepID=UPI0013025762|nr:EAL domain-containing protein [Collinsella sp. An2]